MSANKDDKEKKAGLGSFPSIGSTPSIVGGSSSGFGSAVGGLFAGKAGLVAIVLGSATIAAGVGVVYNFIGPSSKSAYSPELFQNSYYEEESSKAGFERAKQGGAAAAEPSTLDIFKEQARKDGLAVEEEKPAADAAAPGVSADASAEAPAAPAATGGGAALAADGGQKLRAAAGFGSKGSGGGSGGSSMPRMQGGGLSGGIGGKFDAIYKPPAQAVGGKVSGMTASAARVKNSPKYTVPNFNKKGAFGQAKSARNLGTQASYSKDAGARGLAGAQFDTAQQTGGGDVGAPETGTGLGGAGVSDGAKLKASDPSLNNNEVTPPKVPEPENVSPWEKTLNMVMYAMLAAAALIFIANAMAKSGTAWMVAAAQYVAWAAMAAAALVIIGALMLMTKYEQKWMGMMYTVLGGALLYMANEARIGAVKAADPATAATKIATTDTSATSMGNALGMAGQAAPKGGTPEKKKSP